MKMHTIRYHIARAAMRCLALLCCALLLLVPVRQAQADHPLIAAGITAGGAITAATILAAGAITAAVITTYGGKSDKDDDSDDDVIIAPGTRVAGNTQRSVEGTSIPIVNEGARISARIDGAAQTISLGSAAVDPRVQRYVARQVAMTLKDGKQGSLDANVDYAFEGDIEKSTEDVASFANTDLVESRFEMRGPGPLLFLVRDLILSTTDVANTFGYSAVTITAQQAGKAVMTWRARVEQGKTPVFDKPRETGAVVESSTGQLHIANLLFAIPVAYDADNHAELVVTMHYEGSGQRIKAAKR